MNPNDIDYVVCGTVIQDSMTTNIAREAILTSGLPDKIAAHTVTQACISSNQALTTALSYVKSGICDVAIAGGVELLSDAPIKLNKKMRQLLISASKIKKPAQYLQLLTKLRPNYLALEVNGLNSIMTF